MLRRAIEDDQLKCITVKENGEILDSVEQSR